MKRREFITIAAGAAATWSIAARAQRRKIWRIGFITSGFLKPGGGDRLLYEAFLAEMKTLGYIEGNNFSMELRSGEGHIPRVPELANELVALNPDVIVAVATPAIAAVQKATLTIPIVMSPSTDPIGSGFVKSFAKPGGNITGVANSYAESTTKPLDIIRSIIPSAKKIAVLMSSNPTHAPLYEVARSAADSMGLSVVPIIAPNALDLVQAFEEIKKEHCDAIYVIADIIKLQIVSLAADAGIPAVYQIGVFVEAGGLASYGASMFWMFRRTAHYVDKILKGEHPSDIPVERPVKFDFMINLKTANALHLAIPENILTLADKVID
jgi:putative ABC transport system substrate-binding protein